MTCISILKGVSKMIRPNNGKDNYNFNVESLIAIIEKNWSHEASRGRKNWELRPLSLTKNMEEGKHGKGSETLLERKIVKAFDEATPQKRVLWNQMPVGSGLLKLPEKEKRDTDCGRLDKRRAIDLVYKVASRHYEFLELKVTRNDGSKDSLKDAALEILAYGLLYLFSRKNKSDLGYDGPRYEVLDASHIGLRVVAQRGYFENQKRSHKDFPVDAVNAALKTYIDGMPVFNGLKMDFGFNVIDLGSLSPDDLRQAIETKKNAYPSN